MVMRATWILTPLLLLSCLAAAPGMTAPVMRVVRTSQPGVSLLQNGSFEAASAGQIVAWQAWQKGYRAAPGEGRGASQAVVCENLTAWWGAGAAQTPRVNL